MEVLEYAQKLCELRAVISGVVLYSQKHFRQQRRLIL